MQTKKNAAALQTNCKVDSQVTILRIVSSCLVLRLEVGVVSSLRPGRRSDGAAGLAGLARLFRHLHSALSPAHESQNVYISQTEVTATVGGEVKGPRHSRTVPALVPAEVMTEMQWRRRRHHSTASVSASASAFASVSISGSASVPVSVTFLIRLYLITPSSSPAVGWTTGQAHHSLHPPAAPFRRI